MRVDLLVSISDVLVDLLISHQNFLEVAKTNITTFQVFSFFSFCQLKILYYGRKWFILVILYVSQNNRPISIVSVIFRTVKFQCFHFRTVLCCVIIRFSLQLQFVKVSPRLTLLKIYFQGGIQTYNKSSPVILLQEIRIRIEDKNYSATRTRLVVAGLSCFETFLIFSFNTSQLCLDKSVELGGRDVSGFGSTFR